ncbi:hypothetical protein CLIB1423_01S13014 [[Candida] railenensis]|uniref:Membrane anchor Opy2 N-terminal domain-containing protein n=1 Tax=[Candida] railenensis TaxID=45579 RepID=A0A9P0QLF2_9ASCO|nr:hypothetical protein CLIB1423_01S13014 [[Candida] railenensis]
MQLDLVPTRIIFERATTSSESPTASTGTCISCPAVTDTCDTLNCDSDEECKQVAQSCYSCAKLYCAKSSDSSGSGAPIGGIVGGVVGGLAILAIAALLYYFFVWKKKHPVALADDDIMMSGAVSGSLSGEEGESSYAISQMDSQFGVDPATAPLANSTTTSGGSGAAEKRPSNRRLSTYESFTRPQARYANKKVQNRSINKSQQQQQLVQLQQQQNSSLQQQLHQQQVYLDHNSSNRNSVATSISTTNASNILPIAYIPGVTVRPTKNNTRSIYSYETESVFSDLNTIENASIIGARPHQSEHQKDGTMTAIKAQPRLVNVGKIEEEEDEDEEEDDDDDADDDDDEDEDEDDDDGENDDDDEDDDDDDEETDSDLDSDSDLENYNAKIVGNNRASKQTMNTVTTTESEDSDIDSDLGEIERATSLRRTARMVNGPTLTTVNGAGAGEGSLDSPQISQGGASTLNYVDMERPNIPTRADSPQSSNHGSFLLNVDLVGPSPKKNTDSARQSPFEDPKS